MENKVLKVHFYATLRPIIGKKTVELPLQEGLTAIQLVRIFVRDYPLMHKELLDEDGNFLPHMKFFINGRQAEYLPNKMDTEVAQNDIIDIFPPVGGG